MVPDNVTVNLSRISGTTPWMREFNKGPQISTFLSELVGHHAISTKLRSREGDVHHLFATLTMLGFKVLHTHDNSHTPLESLQENCSACVFSRSSMTPFQAKTHIMSIQKWTLGPPFESCHMYLYKQNSRCHPT